MFRPFKDSRPVGPFFQTNKSKQYSQNVSEEVQQEFEQLMFRPHSYRGYDPQEFIDLVNGGVNSADLRGEMEVIEAGRFYEMLDVMFDFWIPLDSDEKQLFVNRNPYIVEWLEVYALLEGYRLASDDAELKHVQLDKDSVEQARKKLRGT